MRSADFVVAKNAGAGIADTRRAGRDGIFVDSKPAGSAGKRTSLTRSRTFVRTGSSFESRDTAFVRNGSGGACAGSGALEGAAAIFTGGTTLGSASTEIRIMAKVRDRNVCLRLFVGTKILALEVRLGSGKCDICYSWLAARNVPVNRQ